MAVQVYSDIAQFTRSGGGGGDSRQNAQISELEDDVGDTSDPPAESLAPPNTIDQLLNRYSLTSIVKRLITEVNLLKNEILEEGGHVPDIFNEPGIRAITIIGNSGDAEQATIRGWRFHYDDMGNYVPQGERGTTLYSLIKHLFTATGEYDSMFMEIEPKIERNEREIRSLQNANSNMDIPSQISSFNGGIFIFPQAMIDDNNYQETLVDFIRWVGARITSIETLQAKHTRQITTLMTFRQGGNRVNLQPLMDKDIELQDDIDVNTAAIRDLQRDVANIDTSGSSGGGAPSEKREVTLLKGEQIILHNRITNVTKENCAVWMRFRSETFLRYSFYIRNSFRDFKNYLMNGSSEANPIAKVVLKNDNEIERQFNIHHHPITVPRSSTITIYIEPWMPEDAFETRSDLPGSIQIPSKTNVRYSLTQSSQVLFDGLDFPETLRGTPREVEIEMPVDANSEIEITFYPEYYYFMCLNSDTLSPLSVVEHHRTTWAPVRYSAQGFLASNLCLDPPVVRPPVLSGLQLNNLPYHSHEAGNPSQGRFNRRRCQYQMREHNGTATPLSTLNPTSRELRAMNEYFWFHMEFNTTSRFIQTGEGGGVANSINLAQFHIFRHKLVVMPRGIDLSEMLIEIIIKKEYTGNDPLDENQTQHDVKRRSNILLIKITSPPDPDTLEYSYTLYANDAFMGDNHYHQFTPPGLSFFTSNELYNNPNTDESFAIAWDSSGFAAGINGPGSIIGEPFIPEVYCSDKYYRHLNQTSRYPQAVFSQGGVIDDLATPDDIAREIGTFSSTLEGRIDRIIQTRLAGEDSNSIEDEGVTSNLAVQRAFFDEQTILRHASVGYNKSYGDRDVPAPAGYNFLIDNDTLNVPGLGTWTKLPTEKLNFKIHSTGIVDHKEIQLNISLLDNGHVGSEAEERRVGIFDKYYSAKDEWYAGGGRAINLFMPNNPDALLPTTEVLTDRPGDRVRTSWGFVPAETAITSYNETPGIFHGANHIHFDYDINNRPNVFKKPWLHADGEAASFTLWYQEPANGHRDSLYNKRAGTSNLPNGEVHYITGKEKMNNPDNSARAKYRNRENVEMDDPIFLKDLPKGGFIKAKFEAEGDFTMLSAHQKQWQQFYPPNRTKKLFYGEDLNHRHAGEGFRYLLANNDDFNATYSEVLLQNVCDRQVEEEYPGGMHIKGLFVPREEPEYIRNVKRYAYQGQPGYPADETIDPSDYNYGEWSDGASEQYRLRRFRRQSHPYAWWPFSLNPDRRTMSDADEAPLLPKITLTSVVSNNIQLQETRPENWNTNPTYWRKSMSNQYAYLNSEFNDSLEEYRGSSYSGTKSFETVAFVDCLQQPIRATKAYCHGWANNPSYQNIDKRRDTNLRTGTYTRSDTRTDGDTDIWGDYGLSGGQNEEPVMQSNQHRTDNWYWVTLDGSKCPGYSRGRYRRIPGNSNQVNARNFLPPYSHPVNWFGFIWGILGGRVSSRGGQLAASNMKVFREEFTKGLYGADPWVDNRISGRQLYENFIGWDKARVDEESNSDNQTGYFIPDRTNDYPDDQRDRVYRPSDTRLLIDPEESAYFMDTRFLETVCSEMFCQYNIICKTTTQPQVVFELIVKIHGTPRKESRTNEQAERLIGRNHRVMYDFEVSTSVKPFV